MEEVEQKTVRCRIDEYFVIADVVRHYDDGGGFFDDTDLLEAYESRDGVWEEIYPYAPEFPADVRRKLFLAVTENFHSAPKVVEDFS